MPISAEPRVALYFDFDNIVISRYDQLHGDSQYRRDTSRRKTVSPETADRLAQATVDVDAVLDFAATFGTIAIARAYADWSTPVNASYRGQLIDRAVDLVQLFPLSATKNGADIRLAVDAIEDMFRIDDLTHIVIVAGDSDYVALAQKAKRLGRYVVGIGVAGGTSRALTAACDEYADYDALLDLEEAADQATDAATTTDAASQPPAASARRGPKKAPAAKDATVAADAAPAADAAADAAPEAAAAGGAKTDAGTAPAKRTNRRAKSGVTSAKAAAAAIESEEPDDVFVLETSGPRGVPVVAFMPPGAEAPTRNPGRLLVKALELLRAKNDEEWQSSGAVKNQMLRMDPSFQERRLGFGSFTDFLKSRGGVVEVDESGRGRVRIRPDKD
ncbi:TIGR00288 family protein [Agromyces sp. CF514]|uniref:NYN domain-containing protein n=1 Tax=Agromyces sp. CF514 TaxID=1881031 RepID=UPI0008E5C470|nr:NYN domain-containing protein [Agromyces sp. CF514]SFR68502.1 TIGR00288 family protein [Agromyces sp. CF514]